MSVACLEIDLAALVANWRRLGALHGAPVAGVLKADAYGLGAARVAPALHAAGCRHFFVAHPEEALAIRALVPDAMLAVLNGLFPGAAREYAEAGLTPVLGSLGEIAAWSDEARRRGARLPCLLHVETGMNRLGLDARDVARLAEAPGRLDGLDLRYVMTHLASADRPGDPANEAQLARFAAARAMLPPAPSSLANSSGLFLGRRFASDLGRPGAALYGVHPGAPEQPNPMRPVVRLRARVLQLRDVAPGECVGYAGAWRASRPSRIAVVSVGYADGFLRSLSNSGGAGFDGRVLPLVGRVSMDLTTFDATDAPGLAEGGWIDLIGPDMPVDEVARRAGTIGYEVLTGLGPRYQRRYLPA